MIMKLKYLIYGKVWPIGYMYVFLYVHYVEFLNPDTVSEQKYFLFFPVS